MDFPSEGCEGGASYIDVCVIEELSGDVGAAVPLGGRRHVSVAVPLPAGAVGIAGGWGGMLNTCGCDDANGLAYKTNWFHV